MDKNFQLKPALISIIISLIAVGLVAFVFGFLYHKFEKEKLPQIEEKMEENMAENLLDKFMRARISGDKEAVKIYLTERAMEEVLKNKFELGDNFKNYWVLNKKKLEKGKYLFLVEIQRNNNLEKIIEAIKIIKILDKYYIDSVELAG